MNDKVRQNSRTDKFDKLPDAEKLDAEKQLDMLQRIKETVTDYTHESSMKYYNFREKIRNTIHKFQDYKFRGDILKAYDKLKMLSNEGPIEYAKDVKDKAGDYFRAERIAIEQFQAVGFEPFGIKKRIYKAKINDVISDGIGGITNPKDIVGSLTKSVKAYKKAAKPYAVAKKKEMEDRTKRYKAALDKFNKLV